jgi:hypothetical protein
MSALNEFVQKIPRTFFVAGVLVVGVALILLINPPYTVCDSQWDVFQAHQTPFLFLNKSKAYIKTLGIDAATEKCKKGNNAGACQELFQGVLSMLKDFEIVSNECTNIFLSKNIVRKTIWDTQELMVQLAWGTKPPNSVYERFGWLDNNHMFLFCRLKEFAIKDKGKDAWEAWREKNMMALPQAEQIGRGEAWKRSLFSARCSDFL